VEKVIANKCNHLVSASIFSLDPTLHQFLCHCIIEDDKTIATLNQSMVQKRVTYEFDPILQHTMAIGIATDCTIADTGATNIL
jgi:hypothetical protein